MSFSTRESLLHYACLKTFPKRAKTLKAPLAYRRVEPSFFALQPGMRADTEQKLIKNHKAPALPENA